MKKISFNGGVEYVFAEGVDTVSMVGVNRKTGETYISNYERNLISVISGPYTPLCSRLIDLSDMDNGWVLTTNPDNGDIYVCCRMEYLTSHVFRLRCYSSTETNIKLTKEMDITLPSEAPFPFFFDVTSIFYSEIDKKIQIYWNNVEYEDDISGIVTVNPSNWSVDKYVPFMGELVTRNTEVTNTIEDSVHGYDFFLEYSGGYVGVLEPLNNYKVSFFNLGASTNQGLNAIVNGDELFLLEKEFISIGLNMHYYITQFHIGADGVITQDDTFELPDHESYLNIFYVAEVNSFIIPSNKNIYTYSCDDKKLTQYSYGWVAPYLLESERVYHARYNEFERMLYLYAEDKEVIVTVSITIEDTI